MTVLKWGQVIETVGDLGRKGNDGSPPAVGSSLHRLEGKNSSRIVADVARRGKGENYAMRPGYRDPGRRPVDRDRLQRIETALARLRFPKTGVFAAPASSPSPTIPQNASPSLAVSTRVGRRQSRPPASNPRMWSGRTKRAEPDGIAAVLFKMC